MAQGIDLIWESVGGEMFTTCTHALAQGGRLIVIGMMSQYSDGWAPSKVASPQTHICFLWLSTFTRRVLIFPCLPYRLTRLETLQQDLYLG